MNPELIKLLEKAEKDAKQLQERLTLTYAKLLRSQNVEYQKQADKRKDS